MKKIILTALVAVATLSASAQFYVGGAIGFQTSKSGEKDAKAQNVFTLSPEIGYDINEKRVKLYPSAVILHHVRKSQSQ